MRGELYKHSAPKTGVQFALMQWSCMNSKRELRPQYLWETETMDEKKISETWLKEKNDKAVEKLKRKKKSKNRKDYRISRTKSKS